MTEGADLAINSVTQKHIGRISWPADCWTGLQPETSNMHRCVCYGIRRVCSASVQGSELGFNLPHASIQVIIPSANLLKYGSTGPSSFRTCIEDLHN